MIAQRNSKENQRIIMWRDAGIAGALYVLGYFSLTYFMGHSLNPHWLVWPALATACAMFAADRTGHGETVWFIRTLSCLLVAVAIIGAVMS